MRFSHTPSLACLLLTPALAALLGCDSSDEIKVYQVSKESETARTPAADPHAGVPMPTPGGADPHAGIPMPTPGAPDPHAGLGIGGTPGTASKPGVEGDVPDTWKPGGGSSMRLASYVVAGEGETVADVSLIILGGGAGGLRENVNRWRTQIGLEALDEAAFAATSEKFTTPQGEGIVVDLEAASPPAEPAKDGRIVGVIVPLASEMWFYKLRGNAELVGREKEGFLRWAASARKVAPAPAEPTPAPPATTPQAPSEISWKVPDGWREAPAKSMRVAAFSVGAAAPDPGEVTVIKLSGSAGGDLANVNRWRGQIGLEPVTADALAAAVVPVESPAGTISLVDCAGGEKRTLAAWLSHEGNTWFFKLTGPSTVVADEEARFNSFLASIEFPAK